LSDWTTDYRKLKFDWPEERILRITMENPGRLNSADAVMHGELVRVWRDIDADPRVSCAIIRGAGEAFSAGGDLDLVEEMTQDFDTLTRVWKEARDLVYNLVNCSKPIVSAMQGPAVGAGLVAGLLADVSIAARTARIIDGHTRLGVAAGDHAAICWPLLCGMAKAKYYLLTCEELSGEVRGDPLVKLLRSDVHALSPRHHHDKDFSGRANVKADHIFRQDLCPAFISVCRL
jgi:enoyl-CoA hydratase